MWAGSASDLLRLCAEDVRADISRGTPWTKNPWATAAGADVPPGAGIEITFSPEGRTGTRTIRMSTSAENTVSTVSMVSAVRSRESRGDQAILAGVRK